MSEYPKKIRYPDFINLSGDLIGTIRNTINLEMNEKAARYKRGGRSSDVNNLGARGELIARYVCFSREIGFKATSLIASKPLSEPDIILDLGHRIDVKTIRTDAPDLLVNKEAHQKVKKNISHYMFIQQIGEAEARYWIYKYEAISNWNIKNCKYSDAYYLNINANTEVAA